MTYPNMTNEKIVTHVNYLVKQWSEQFENPPKELPVYFSVNDSGMLCANGVVLFLAQHIFLDSLDFEIERLLVSSSDGDEFEIGINWPVAGPPYMSYIVKKTTLFAAP